MIKGSMRIRFKKGTFADLGGVDIERRKRNFLKAVGIEGENALKAEANHIQAYGTAERSIYHKVGKDRVTIGSDLYYFEIAMEYGRKPGKTPPIEAIKLWARKRGIPEYAAYMIARKIAKYGTRLNQMGAPKRITRARKLIDTYKIPRLSKLYLTNDRII